jgi:hypothetical protein
LFDSEFEAIRTVLTIDNVEAIVIIEDCFDSVVGVGTGDFFAIA